MTDELLKQALKEAMMQELETLPAEEELKNRYQFSKEFEKSMDLLVKQTNRKYVTIGRYTIRKAMLAALIAVMLLTGCIGIRPVREAIIQFFVETNEKNSLLTFSGFSSTEPNTDFDFKPITPKVPEGYTLTSETLWESYYELQYENSNGEIIFYTQMIPNESTVVRIDTEGVQLKYIDINGYKGIQYSKYDENNISWTDEHYFYDLIGTCEMSVLEEIAEDLMQ